MCASFGACSAINIAVYLVVGAIRFEPIGEPFKVSLLILDGLLRANSRPAAGCCTRER